MAPIFDVNSKEAFISTYIGELYGFSLEALMLVVEEDKKKQLSPAFSAARKGEFAIAQMKRVRELLAKMHDDLPKLQIIKEALTLEEVIAAAKVLCEADRVKFREWIEKVPRVNGHAKNNEMVVR